MTGRILALCGWLAWQISRPLRRTTVGRLVPIALAAVLLVAAALPLVIPMLDPQPRDATVQEVVDRDVDVDNGWVRLRGRITPLSETPTGEPGDFALLVDATDTLNAIVLRDDEPFEPVDSTTITGQLAAAGAIVDEELPIEATVHGTPPRVVLDRVVDVDEVPKPPRDIAWQLSVLPALLAIVLLAGARAGYPVFRPTSEIDVLATPLSPGERVPTAFGGRVGPTTHDLTDPGEALLVVRRGASGNLLTAEPLGAPGQAATAPVPIGGGWTRGRIGDVYTVSEIVPALAVSSEQVEATFLFARTAERDRVAALVAVER